MDLTAKKQIIVDLFIQLQHSDKPYSSILQQYKLVFKQTKTQLGSCHYGKKQIAISEHILANNDISIQIDTLKHECAHALAFADGERGHGKIWRQWAVALGATPKSRTSEKINTQAKYHLVRLKGGSLQVLQRTYHRRVSLKGKYMRHDKSSLNQLYLIPLAELDAYKAGELTVSQLTLLQ